MGQPQADLFAATPAARNTDPETSHEAAEAITASGARGRQQREVLELVRRWPGHTSAELAWRHGRMDRWQTARRLPELVPVHVEKGPAKRCTITRRRCVTWWPKGRATE